MDGSELCLNDGKIGKVGHNDCALADLLTASKLPRSRKANWGQVWPQWQLPLLFHRIETSKCQQSTGDGAPGAPWPG